MLGTWDTGFSGDTVVKNPPASAEDVGSVLSERSPEGGNGNPLHGKPMDRGAGGLQTVESQRVGHDWATEQVGISNLVWETDSEQRLNHMMWVIKGRCKELWEYLRGYLIWQGQGARTTYWGCRVRPEGGAGSGLKRVEAGEGQEESTVKALRLVPLWRGREHHDLCPQAGKQEWQKEQLETDQVAGSCETLRLSTLELIPGATESSQGSVLSFRSFGVWMEQEHICRGLVGNFCKCLRQRRWWVCPGWCLENPMDRGTWWATV